MSVRTLISGVLPDPTTTPGGTTDADLTGSLLQVVDAAGNIRWTTSSSNVSLGAITCTSITVNGNATCATLTVNTSANIGATNSTTPALGIQSKIGIGLSRDVPASFFGIWIGNTANALQDTTSYNVLGDDAGNTYINSPSASGAVFFRINNAGRASLTNAGFQASMRYFLQAQSTAATALTNSAFTQIPYATVLVTTSNFTYNTGTGAWTAPEAGRYWIRASACVNYGVGAGQNITTMSIFVNGTEISRGTRMDFNVTATAFAGVTVDDWLQLALNDVVTIRVFESCGANKALNGVATDNRLTILGPF